LSEKQGNVNLCYSCHGIVSVFSLILVQIIEMLDRKFGRETCQKNFLQIASAVFSVSCT